MKAGGKALLERIVDYAGLFPPAALSLDEAIRNYARYQAEAEAWMLARFVCPAARLGELEPYVGELFASGPPLAISALGRSGATTAAFLTGLDEDLRAMAAFRERHGERVRVDALETRVPEEVVAEGERGPVDQLLNAAAEALRAAGEDGLAVFFEVPRAGSWEATAGRVAAALAECNQNGRGDSGRFGFKLRTGGLEPAAFPSSAEIAVALTAAREHDLPQKFTAGLHHPIRHYSSAVRCEMHGFLNVFVAGVLGRDLRLEHHDLCAILDETDPRQFSISDQFVGWNEWETEIEDVRHWRERGVVSFGSCSFDEPREDLKTIGWLA